MSMLRLAAVMDLPRIMEIIAQAQAYLAAQGVDQWQDGYPDEAVMGEDIALSRGYVYERDGKVCGIATIVFDGEPTYDKIFEGAWETAEPYACIHRIAVDATLRGSGVSGAMMRAADDLIRAKGMTSVRIDTHRDNVIMQRMLAKNGYRKCGIIYLDTGAERIALEKSLDGA